MYNTLSFPPIKSCLAHHHVKKYKIKTVSIVEIALNIDFKTNINSEVTNGYTFIQLLLSRLFII